MDSVSFTLKRRIMEEFYFGFLSEQFSEEGGDDEDEGPIKPFEFLTEMTDEQLVALLANEDVPEHLHSQVVQQAAHRSFQLKTQMA